MKMIFCAQKTSATTSKPTPTTEKVTKTPKTEKSSETAETETETQDGDDSTMGIYFHGHISKAKAEGSFSF